MFRNLFRNPTATDTDLNLVKREVEENQAQILDVREKNEWDAGHLKPAIFAPLSLLSQHQAPAHLDKAKRTYVHCAAGGRVAAAKSQLESIGFTDVIPLSEGYTALARIGFETA